MTPDLVGPGAAPASPSSETATLRSQIEEEWKQKAGEWLLALLEDACKAARIDPKEYLPDSEGGDERGYSDKELKVRWMRVAIAANEQAALSHEAAAQARQIIPQKHPQDTSTMSDEYYPGSTDAEDVRGLLWGGELWVHPEYGSAPCTTPNWPDMLGWRKIRVGEIRQAKEGEIRSN